MMSVKNILRFLYKPYKWLIFAPCLVIITVTASTALVIVAKVLTPEIASRTMAVLWARLNSYVTPMLVSVRGRRNIKQGTSYVVVANHQSQYDIFVLYGWLGVDFKWVMKEELRKVPFIGYVCEVMGHIYIDRSDTGAAVASINAAREKINGGISVIFFPEGTRSKDAQIGNFKKGAFKFAVDLGLPILPVTILGTNKILPAKSIDLFPGRAKMIIHEPIDTRKYDDSTLEQLADVSRDVIKSRLPEAGSGKSSKAFY